MQNQQRVKKEESAHRDEMNLVEFPIGVLADRVPTDPETGLEIRELILQRTIFEDSQPTEQKWIVRGHIDYGGIPRGQDIDAFNALMTLWSRSDFQHRIISTGSIYSFLEMTGKSDGGLNYRRFHKSMDRLYGVMFEAYYALWNPGTQRRIPQWRFKLLSSDMPRSKEDQRPRGLVHISEEFYTLVKQGYLKITDMERYWRLPSVGARRMFQFLDKQRRRAFEEHKGKYTINGYLLLKKLGTLDYTLKHYSANKVRSLVETMLDALIADGYLLDYCWRKEGKSRAPIQLYVTYAPDEAEAKPSPLSEREAAAVDEIGRLLDEPTNRSYHAFIVRELGADRARRLASQVLAQAERQSRRTHKGKLFSYLARKERERSSRSAA